MHATTKPTFSRSFNPIAGHLRRNLVAYLALMIAFAFSPVPSWATGKIGTKQLKNNAVSAAKIKNGAVTGAKIKDGAVSAEKLAPGAVSGDRLANGSVTSSNVLDGAITGPKIETGSVESVHIADGSILKEDLAPAVRGFTSLVARQTILPGVTGSGVALSSMNCLAGEVAIGGGGHFTMPSGSGMTGRITRSTPIARAGEGGLSSFEPVGWHIRIENEWETTATARVFVLCASR